MGFFKSSSNQSKYYEYKFETVKDQEERTRLNLKPKDLNKQTDYTNIHKTIQTNGWVL